MPVVTRNAPSLVAEGEYKGQCRKVQQEWSKPRKLPDGTITKSHPVFKMPLHLPDGKMVIHRLHLTENTGDLVVQACKSGGLEIPDPDEHKPFVLGADDLEGRVFHFGIVHTEWNGIKRAEVKFHVESYALQVNPALEKVSFPNEAPRGVMLRPAPDSAPPKPEPRSEAAGSGASQPSIPPQPQAPATDTKSELETLSQEEFQQALEYAKKLRQQKPEGK